MPAPIEDRGDPGGAAVAGGTSVVARSRRRMVGSLPAVDPDDTTFLYGERQPAVLQREGSFAEQFTSPAAQRADIGVVIGRDLLEVIHRRDHLGRDRVSLGGHAQQNL